MRAVALRIALVAAWLALIGAHAARHLGAGGAALTPAFDARLGQRLTYAVLVDRGGAQRLAGLCVWSCERGADGPRVHAHASLSDASFIPGFTRLAAAIGENGSGARQLELELTEDHGVDGRLERLSGEARAFGAAATGSAELSAAGLETKWSMPGVTEGGARYATPRLGDATTAMLLGALPAGLHPGERFALATLGADPVSLAPQARRATFAVGSEVEESTALGQRLLLPITEDDVAGHGSHLWCDASGLVHRARIDALGLTLELRSVAGAAP